MSKSDIINRIGGYFPRIAMVVRTGFESHTRLYGETAEVHTKRTQANLRHDHMVRAALEILPRPDFRPIRAGRRSLFSYRGKLLLQFKKLKPNLMTSNYPTRQAELFDRIGEIPALPGLGDPMPLITFGYVAREAHGLEGIFMTQIVNHRPAWVHRLDDEADEQQPIISILPRNDNPVSPQRSRIRRTRRPGSTDTGTTDS